MIEIFWQGLGSERVYFDGEKLYFVRNPEGFALWIFVMLIVTPLLMVGLERVLPTTLLDLGFAVWGAFAICGVVLSLVYIFLIYQPSKVPGDQRKKYLSYDLRRKILEQKKSDGTVEFLALGNQISVELAQGQVRVQSKYGKSYSVYLVFNGTKRVIASDLDLVNIQKLIGQLEKMGMKSAAA